MGKFEEELDLWMKDPEVMLALVADALNRALPKERYHWYDVLTHTGLPRWLICPLQGQSMDVTHQWAELRGLPEGLYYALEYMPRSHSLAFVHSNSRGGPGNWDDLALRSATLINIACVLLGKHQNIPELGLSAIITRLIERYPPNSYSMT